jgi:hypothetical protein
MKQTEIMNKTFGYALLMGLAIAAVPDMAWAQTTGGIGNTLNTIRTSQFAPILNTMNAVFYIAAFGFAFSGAKGLKDNSENPSTKLAPQIAKLGVAGTLAAAPSLLGRLNESMSLGNASNYTAFTPTF